MHLIKRFLVETYVLKQFVFLKLRKNTIFLENIIPIAGLLKYLRKSNSLFSPSATFMASQSHAIKFFKSLKKK